MEHQKICGYSCCAVLNLIAMPASINALKFEAVSKEQNQKRGDTRLPR
jgi:hypothetical protein